MYEITRTGKVTHGSPNKPATPVTTVCETFDSLDDAIDRIETLWKNPPRESGLRGKFTYDIRDAA